MVVRMDAFEHLLGLRLEPKDLTTLQISLRGIIVFLACIVMIRVGDKRFLSKKSPLDAVVGFIFASMMARAVNGSASFIPTICGGFVIVFLHRALAFLARRFHSVSSLVKGGTDVVIEHGKVREEALAKNNFSEGDLMEDLRINGVATPLEVKLAHVERNGDVSVIKR